MKTYTDIGGNTLPIPPIEDLRVEDWMSLPHERYIAVEAWWIHADHPGFGADASHTVSCMRDAGFAEVEIRDVVIGTLIEAGEPTEAALTDALLQAIKAWREQKREHGVMLDSYRGLVGALLEHSPIEHEGTDSAIADFRAADRAGDVLQQTIALQQQSFGEYDCFCNHCNAERRK